MKLKRIDNAHMDYQIAINEFVDGNLNEHQLVEWVESTIEMTRSSVADGNFLIAQLEGVLKTINE